MPVLVLTMIGGCAGAGHLGAMAGRSAGSQRGAASPPDSCGELMLESDGVQPVAYKVQGSGPDLVADARGTLGKCWDSNL